MGIDILSQENTNSGNKVKYNAAAEGPIRPFRKLEEVPTVQAAGVSRLRLQNENLMDLAYWHDQ